MCASLYTNMHIYTKCASGADNFSDSSGLGGVWRATSPSLPRLQTVAVQVLAADLRHCSKFCQSASAVLHGWERQDSRADFSVFCYTGEGNTCQHTSAQQHLKAVDSLFITASWTACFGKDMFLCLCLHDWITGYYQRRQTDDLMQNLFIWQNMLQKWLILKQNGKKKLW